MNMVRRDLPNQATRSATTAGPAARPGAATPAPARPVAAQPQQPTARPIPPMRPAVAGATVGKPAAVGAPTAQPAARPIVGGRTISPTAKADELAMVMRQLTELLTKENAALKKHKMEDVRALTERKEQLARLYQGHLNAVHKDKKVLAGLEPARRNAITQTAMKLGQLMQDNASLLKANIEAINMFFGAVTEALKHRHDERSAAYSRSGALGNYAVTKRSLAVSFNQTM